MGEQCGQPGCLARAQAQARQRCWSQHLPQADRWPVPRGPSGFISGQSSPSRPSPGPALGGAGLQGHRNRLPAQGDSVPMHRGHGPLWKPLKGWHCPASCLKRLWTGEAGPCRCSLHTPPGEAQVATGLSCSVRGGRGLAPPLPGPLQYEDRGLKLQPPPRSWWPWWWVDSPCPLVSLSGARKPRQSLAAGWGSGHAELRAVPEASVWGQSCPVDAPLPMQRQGPVDTGSPQHPEPGPQWGLQLSRSTAGELGPGRRLRLGARGPSAVVRTRSPGPGAGAGGPAP